MRYPFEEFTQVWAIPGEDAVADLTQPTEGEIALGEDITCFLTKDGLSPGGTTNKVEGGSLCTRVDGQNPGSVGYDFTLTGYRDNAEDGDTFWDLAVWNDPVTIVVRRGVLYGTEVAAGQAVEVYEGAYCEPVPAGSAGNSNQTFTVDVAVQDAELKATVVAGS